MGVDFMHKITFEGDRADVEHFLSECCTFHEDVDREMDSYYWMHGRPIINPLTKINENPEGTPLKVMPRLFLVAENTYRKGIKQNPSYCRFDQLDEPNYPKAFPFFHKEDGTMQGTMQFRGIKAEYKQLLEAIAKLYPQIAFEFHVADDWYYSYDHASVPKGTSEIVWEIIELEPKDGSTPKMTEEEVSAIFRVTEEEIP